MEKLMKTSMLIKLSVLVATLASVTACSVNKDPRQIHEGKKEWAPNQAPTDDSVSVKGYNEFDLRAGFKAVEAGKSDLMATVLQPLSSYLLNAAFIEVPSYRTERTRQMLALFDQAFLLELLKPNKSEDFKQMKTDYINTVLAGCTRDLRSDCRNADLFSTDARFSRIFTILATEKDAAIEKELAASGGDTEACIKTSEACRELIADRYRMLALAVKKRNRNYDSEFTFAYIKYARLFQVWLVSKEAKDDEFSNSYIKKTHASIFEVMIPKFEPKSQDDSEFRTFVSNFNPWTYSLKKSDIFPYGTQIMFKLATGCCLYTKGSDHVLEDAVKNAIVSSQLAEGKIGKDGKVENEDPEFGPSFLNKILNIPAKYRARLFAKLDPKLGERLNDLMDPEKSAFYDELFFIVDRLYRKHLSITEIEMVLGHVNRKHAIEQLPATIRDYMKIQMIYQIYKTNDRMSKIYSQTLSGAQIFTNAVSEATTMNSEWTRLQTQGDLLSQLMGAYFKGLNVRTNAGDDFTNASEMIESINRNIHYFAVYPNMFILNYFVGKVNGTFPIKGFFGGTFEINSETQLDTFLESEEVSPTPDRIWFPFGKSLIPYSRQTLLFAWQYLLSTEALSTFNDNSVNDGASVNNADTAVADGEAAKTTSTDTEEEVAATPRAQFFNLVFQKYIGDERNAMLDALKTFRISTVDNPMYTRAKEVCDFELGLRTFAIPPNVDINFLDLDKATYAGLGSTGYYSVVSSFLTDSNTFLNRYLTTIDRKVNYVRVMLRLIEEDIKKDEIIKFGKSTFDPSKQSHEETKLAYKIISDLQEIRARVQTTFVKNHDYFFRCSIALREIERRRTLKLYDMERTYLGEVYDKLVSQVLPATTIADQKKIAAALNDTYFKGTGKGSFADQFGVPAEIDQLEGKNFRMSKYDLMVRMMYRIQQDDNFSKDVNPVFDDSKLNLTRVRNVSVTIPPNTRIQPFFTDGTSVSLTPDDGREAFIRQGMALLGGKAASFLNWESQMTGDNTFKNYLASLRSAYLLGPVQDPDDSTISRGIVPKNISDAFVAFMASYTLDDLDVKKAIDFGTDGRMLKAFLQPMLFEKDGRKPRPLFYDLMLQVYTAGEFNYGQGDRGPYAESANMARILGSMGTFVFTPSGEVDRAVKEIYGNYINVRLDRINALYKHLDDVGTAAKNNPLNLDSRLGKSFYLENGEERKWFDIKVGVKISDQDRRNIFNTFVDNYSRDTGNYFSTEGAQNRTAEGQ